MSIFPELASLPWPVVLVVGALSLVLIVPRDRRVSQLGLLGYYVWLSTQMQNDLYRALPLVRLGLGIAVFLILAITAQHVESAERRAQVPDVLNSGFRLVLFALGGLVAWAALRQLPLTEVPQGLSLAGYWMAANGLLLILTGSDPLRTGLGLLTLLAAFEGIFLNLEHGLVILGVLSIVDVCVALGVVVFAEQTVNCWLGQAAPDGGDGLADPGGPEALIP